MFLPEIKPETGKKPGMMRDGDPYSSETGISFSRKSFVASANRKKRRAENHDANRGRRCPDLQKTEEIPAETECDWRAVPVGGMPFHPPEIAFRRELLDSLLRRFVLVNKME